MKKTILASYLVALTGSVLVVPTTAHAQSLSSHMNVSIDETSLNNQQPTQQPTQHPTLVGQAVSSFSDPVQSPFRDGQDRSQWMEQEWSAKEIERLGQLQDKQQANAQLTSAEQQVLQDLEEFNKNFSHSYLKGYTSQGQGFQGQGFQGQGLPFDASVETYYVDEYNQVVALYDDHADASELMVSWAGDTTALYPLTRWEENIAPQSLNFEPWVAAKIKDTSVALHQKLQEARLGGQPYLLWVNIPSFTLRMYDTATEELVTQSRVIVGASGSQTPIFTTNIVNLKFNPDWSPPPSLKRRGKRYTPPSDHNPLGQVRFSTDNHMNIYLHDTNNHQLFNQEVRALSAGCVRVENWRDISQYLGGLTSEGVDERILGNRTNYLDIPDSKVWISYERIDMDEAGQLKLFGDIYRKQPLPENMLPRAIP